MRDFDYVEGAMQDNFFTNTQKTFAIAHNCLELMPHVVVSLSRTFFRVSESSAAVVSRRVLE